MAPSTRTYAGVASNASSASSSPSQIFDSPPLPPTSPWSISSTLHSPSSPSDKPHKQISASTKNQKPLSHQIAELNAPQAVVQALENGKDSRHRLTLQLYYGMPTLFDTNRGDEGYQGRIRFLSESEVVAAVKDATALGLNVTMRAALVLLGNEIQTVRIVHAWLISPLVLKTDNAPGLLRLVQRTSSRLQQAERILLDGLTPQDTTIDMTSLYMQDVRQQLDDTERNIVTRASKNAMQASSSDANGVKALSELQLRSALDATAKDLAVVKMTMRPADAVEASSFDNMAAEPSTTLNNFRFQATIYVDQTAYQFTRASIDNRRSPNFISGEAVNGVGIRRQVFPARERVSITFKPGDRTTFTQVVEFPLNISGVTQVTQFYVNDRTDAARLVLGKDGVPLFGVRIVSDVAANSETYTTVTVRYNVTPYKRRRLVVDAVTTDVRSQVLRWDLGYWQQRGGMRGETATDRLKRERTERRMARAAKYRETAQELMLKAEQMCQGPVKRQRVKREIAGNAAMGVKCEFDDLEF
ncbi:hypothetical protein LTR56_015374 [Elasticomyces elasticus]|nr:hypothetical protein LTR56_015374 [Elasticomyces elasticus]KAK3637500.1 hypothetical protein LTR22_018223 [Elasticomyces elasticus]KAK4911467.1 hypothetical protein LTR49_019962 [Elasticomyces elasticus]KAK5768062.1 hypothetical protein LTS12_001879 [Elasticomyces elasticus]